MDDFHKNELKKITKRKNAKNKKFLIQKKDLSIKTICESKNLQYCNREITMIPESSLGES
ncbi:hypothetical protein [Salegentibacter holothuriorum]|uniref:hypothetical protein n=1 Tax=Salegentibacter holothuriorum TaxID=241145 RepID=UPI0009A75089|nr:hypothetical protein [Salegentibacter holothuriorum]